VSVPTLRSYIGHPRCFARRSRDGLDVGRAVEASKSSGVGTAAGYTVEAYTARDEWNDEVAGRHAPSDRSSASVRHLIRPSTAKSPPRPATSPMRAGPAGVMVKNAIASPARRRKKATMTIQSLRRMSGRLGLTGYLVAFLGTLLVAGDWWFESFVAPRIAAVAPEVMSGTTTGSLAVGAAATFGLFALG